MQNKIKTILCRKLALALLCSSATLTVRGEDISFTSEQVDAGKALYQERCQLCHGTTLANGQFATPLKGSFFRNKWQGKTLGELLSFTRDNMPPDNKGSLTAEQNATLVAFILSNNKLGIGTDAMSGDAANYVSLQLPW